MEILHHTVVLWRSNLLRYRRFILISFSPLQTQTFRKAALFCLLVAYPPKVEACASCGYECGVEVADRQGAQEQSFYLDEYSGQGRTDSFKIGSVGDRFRLPIKRFTD
jgi:hypothetical protein